jgi:hypothetical protein
LYLYPNQIKNMKKIALLLSIPLFIISCNGGEKSPEELTIDSSAQVTVEPEEEVDQKKSKSPRLQASGIVDGVQVDIDYGSPFVKDRVIWGDLVAYDKVWRAGANEATAVTFSSAIQIDNKQVPAGTYALFIIPQENGNWTVILNEEWSKEEHGVWGSSDYKKDKDVLRVEVLPLFTDQIQESLKYEVNSFGILFTWEKVSLQINIFASK